MFLRRIQHTPLAFKFKGQVLNLKAHQTVLLRLLKLILVIALAWLWVMLSATPVSAQDSRINYTNTNLRNRDFSNTNLAGSVFVAAEMRGANFQNSDQK